MVLVLVRHGESVWNLENRFTGDINIDLSKHGEEEAQLAGQKLKAYHFSVAFTSALIRAQHTLSIILDEMGTPSLPIIHDKALNERNYGDLQGLNKAETAKRYGDEQVYQWRRSYDVKPPNGESLEDTAARVIPYYQQVILPHIKRGEDVLLVAHGNSLRALMMHLEHIKPEDITAVNFPTGIPRLYTFNDDETLQTAVYL